MKKFSARLAERRRKLGLTQMAFAHLLSTDQGTVSRWEAGRHLPTKNTRRRLAQALNVDEKEL